MNLERRDEQHGSGPGPSLNPAGSPDPASTATIATLLRELGELHDQILTGFEKSLGLMVRLFACLGPEQLLTMQRELERIQELNSELSRLQTELARRAVTQPPAPSIPPVDTPDPTAESSRLDITTLHDWVADRISSLQKERQARWQSLMGMFVATEERNP